MPNWCSNRLTVEGPKELIDSLEKGIQEGTLLETIHPIGEWVYETAVNEWGTKWDVGGNDSNFDRHDDNIIEMWFDSAWGPPIAAYEKLYEKEGIVSVYATYWEPGMGFTGCWDNGNDMFYEEVGTLIRAPESDWDPELSELNEEYCFADWYEEFEEEELSTWIEEGAKAREEMNE